MPKNLLIFLPFALALCGCGGEFTITKTGLSDKIKGGWAGQFIGCAYGGPTEFKYVNKTIPPEVKLGFSPDKPLVKREFGGLYDDVYMDATFVAVLEKHGLNAPRRAFAAAIADAPYQLWCANKAARFEYLDGYRLGEPVSWRHNPNSNDIDFQIEADFAGLISPAMPHAAIKFCDTVGRIFNDGEGYYCGACVAAMYSLAFKTARPLDWVEGALETIPKESYAHSIISQILRQYKQDPSDWLAAWRIVSAQYGKPRRTFAKDMLYAPYNLAYLAIALLYGGGDFEKTIDIATRCGLDSDCNPATAGGIVGASIGYAKIPVKFRKPLEMSETMRLFGTGYTPAALYSAGEKLAIKVLEANGAKFGDKEISIPRRRAKRLKFEAPAPRMSVARSQKITLKDGATKSETFSESGVEVFVYPYTLANQDAAKAGKIAGEIALIEVSINGKPARTAKFFGDPHRVHRKFAFADFGLPCGKKTITLAFRKKAAQTADFFCELRYYNAAQNGGGAR